MKILFSDFDGTLVDHDQPITPRNIEMMHMLHQHGHLVVVCTGRNIQEFRTAMDLCNIPFDYAVLNNGGQIINQNYEVLYEKTIERNVGIDILNHTIQYKGMWSYFCEEEEAYGYKDGQTYIQALGNKEIQEDFIALYHQAKHFQIIAFHQDDEGLDNVRLCLDYIHQHYDEKVEVYLNTHFVDVVPQGCSKGIGMKVLLDLIHQPVEAVYAIGDSYNDLSMIHAADYGYTFMHADEEIKKQTNLHVQYVYEVIEDMLGGNINELEG